MPTSSPSTHSILQTASQGILRLREARGKAGEGGKTSPRNTSLHQDGIFHHPLENLSAGETINSTQMKYS